jgi:hypothetical protein
MTFKSKKKDILAATKPLVFNGCVISMIDDIIQCTQKEQERRIIIIN